MNTPVKTILFTFLLLQIIATHAQFTFKQQLDELLADSNNYFKKLKGEFKEVRGYDSVFYSRSTLDGTTENDVTSQTSRERKPFGMYLAIIGDSVSQKTGTRMIKLWKQKLESLLGPFYRIKKKEPALIDPYESGWVFQRGSLSISIMLFKANTRKKLYFILLNVFYFTDKNAVKL